jgi:hypothetical protein
VIARPRRQRPARPRGATGVAAALAPAFCGLPSGAAQAAATAWVIQATPATGSKVADLAAVSCGSATACAAVGTASTAAVSHPLAESRQASGWTIQKVPSPAGSAGAVLAGPSCPSAACTATGSYQASGHTLKKPAERYQPETRSSR